MLPSPHTETAGPESHFVQLEGGNGAHVADNVCRFLHEGWGRGEGMLVVATAEHRIAFLDGLEKLGVPVEEAIREGRLVVLDSQHTLSRFLKDGQPNWDRFDHTVGAAVREFGRGAGKNGFRAFGDMVGILWTAGQFSAAIELEHFWNRLMRDNSFQLFCAYPVDVLDEQFDAATIDAMLSTHSHLVPAAPEVRSALDRAMNETLGAKAKDLRFDRSSKAGLPEVEGTILRLKKNLPEKAGEILARARRYYLEAHSGH